MWTFSFFFFVAMDNLLQTIYIYFFQRSQTTSTKGKKNVEDTSTNFIILPKQTLACVAIIFVCPGSSKDRSLQMIDSNLQHSQELLSFLPNLTELLLDHKNCQYGICFCPLLLEDIYRNFFSYSMVKISKWSWWGYAISILRSITWDGRNFTKTILLSVTSR